MLWNTNLCLSSFYLHKPVRGILPRWFGSWWVLLSALYISVHDIPFTSHWGERAWAAAWSELEEGSKPPEDNIMKRTQRHTAKLPQHEEEIFYFVLVGFFWNCNLSKVKNKSHTFHDFCISPHFILPSNDLDVSFNCPGHIWFLHMDFFLNLICISFFSPCPTHEILFFLLPASTEFLSFSDFTCCLAALTDEHNNKPLPLDLIWILTS